MKIATAAVLALALALLGCSKKAMEVPPEEAAELLLNRSWIDRMPESADERLHVYRFTPSAGGGIYQDRTLFAGDFELFTFKLGEGSVRINWPHRDVKEELRYQIERVDGPEPFDLRLHLEGNSTGPSIYYGQSGEGRGMDPLFLTLP